MILQKSKNKNSMMMNGSGKERRGSTYCRLHPNAAKQIHNIVSQHLLLRTPSAKRPKEYKFILEA
jgi:hypothetical protein